MEKNISQLNSIQNVVALIGLPRSGTTCLTAYFDAYSEIYSIFEPWNANQKLNPEPYLDLENFLINFNVNFSNTTTIFVKETSTKIQYIDSINYLLHSVKQPRKKLLIFLVRDPFHIFLSEFQARKNWWGSPDLKLDVDLFSEWSKKILNSLRYILKILAQQPSVVLSYHNLIKNPNIVYDIFKKINIDFDVYLSENFHEKVNLKKVKGDISFFTNPRSFDLTSSQIRDNEILKIESILQESIYYNTIKRLRDNIMKIDKLINVDQQWIQEISLIVNEFE